MDFAGILKAVNDFVWGPFMLILLVGTGVFLTFRLKFLPWRNLGFALKSIFKDPDKEGMGSREGDITPFQSLMTALAATIGTGNIVGVATAMVMGGPGAIVWMWISALFGLSTKYVESVLAVKYREMNADGEMVGGPMYAMRNGFKHKRLGAVLATLFAVFAVLASFGIGNMTQANSIADALSSTFRIPNIVTGVGGNIVAKMSSAMRWGVARGVFSNEAGLGSAPIAAAAAKTDYPSRQGYINMTGTFFDTLVVCSVTGLVIASSGVLGMKDASGEVITGVNLTIKAFESALGPMGSYLVSIGIMLFAFSTILGWEYYGEKSLEFLVHSTKMNRIYRVLFSFVTFIGATRTLQIVWDFSDTMNGLMAIPNLICLLVLSNVAAEECFGFQKEIKKK